jgi:hypothetical protein
VYLCESNSENNLKLQVLFGIATLLVHKPLHLLIWLKRTKIIDENGFKKSIPILFNEAAFPMSNITHSVSACRRCFHYRSEGRRGGQCSLLGASVQGQWSACAAAQPLFEPAIAPSSSSKAIALEEMITALKVGTEALEPTSLESHSYAEIYLASELEATPEAIGSLATAAAR